MTDAEVNCVAERARLSLDPPCLQGKMTHVRISCLPLTVRQRVTVCDAEWHMQEVDM